MKGRKKNKNIEKQNGKGKRRNESVPLFQNQESLVGMVGGVEIQREGKQRGSLLLYFSSPGLGRQLSAIIENKTTRLGCNNK